MLLIISKCENRLEKVCKICAEFTKMVHRILTTAASALDVVHPDDKGKGKGKAMMIYCHITEHGFISR